MNNTKSQKAVKLRLRYVQQKEQPKGTLCQQKQQICSSCDNLKLKASDVFNVTYDSIRIIQHNNVERKTLNKTLNAQVVNNERDGNCYFRCISQCMLY